MKNPTRFSKALLHASLIITLFIGTTSLAHSQTTPVTKKEAKQENDGKYNHTHAEKDANFLVKAAGLHLDEIRLAQLAQENSSQLDIKELGRMIEQAHRNSLNELNALALRESVTLPNVPTEGSTEIYKSLKTKTGNNFDKDFCSQVANDHKAAIEAFEEIATECSEVHIKEWATATLATLRTHLDMATTCEKKYTKM